MSAGPLLVLLLGVAGCAMSLDESFEDEWYSFMNNFNKNYANEMELLERKLIFLENMKLIDEHNARWAAGEESYEMGINQFSDMTAEEISQQVGENNDEEPDLDAEYYDYSFDFGVPPKVNWSAMSAVTPVMNQGHFNNSWAFAAAGVTESRQFIKHGKLTVLSKQNLIDCCRTWSRPTLSALQCIKKKGGIDFEGRYRYRGAKGKCRFQKRYVAAKIKKIYHLRPGNEKALASVVAKGPVSALIPHDALVHYKSGVYNNPHCGHVAKFAVLIVGYDHSPIHGDYWILKTSLGQQWGERGYMKMARNRHNLCGITNNIYFPETV